MIDGTDEAHEAAVQGGPLDPRLHGYAEETYVTPAERRKAAALPVADRQSLVARMLVRSPTFTATIAAVRRFHMPVTGAHAQSQMIAGVLGDTRTGKSWALKHYVHGLGAKEVENATIPRALYVNCMERDTSTLIAAKLRRELGLRPRRASSNEILENAVDQMRLFGVELLILDDAQFALGSKLEKTREEITGLIRRVYECHAGCVILAGDDGIDAMVRANGLLEGRGAWPTHRVGAYGWSHDEHDPGEFREVLDEIADRLPFKDTPRLGEVTTAAHLHKLSGGRLGAAMNYVRAAAYAALEDRADTITIGHLRAVAAMRRRVGDPYEAFVSRIDVTDPTGRRRATATAATVEANADPILERKRRRQPFTERERA